MSRYERIYKSDKKAEINYNGNVLSLSDFSFDRYDYYGDSTDSYIQVYAKVGSYSGLGKIFINYNTFTDLVNDLKRMDRFECSEARLICTYEISDLLYFSMNKLGQLSISGHISNYNCELSFEMEADQTVLTAFYNQLNSWVNSIQRKGKSQ